MGKRSRKERQRIRQEEVALKRPRKRIEAGSLFHALKENPGAALYVLPICWTDQHAELLNARWVELPPSVMPVPSPGKRYLFPSPMARKLSDELSTLVAGQELRMWAKLSAVRDVLSLLYPGSLSESRTGVELDLCIGDRRYRKACRVHVLWQPWKSNDRASFETAPTRGCSFAHSQRSINSSSQGMPTPPSPSPSTPVSDDESAELVRRTPILAFINRTQLAHVRRNLFRIVANPAPNSGPNEPVTNLQRLRSKQLVPANTEHDSYYLGVILALAQSKFYGEGPCGDPSWPDSSEILSERARRSVRRKVDSQPPVFRDIEVRLITHADMVESTGSGLRVLDRPITADAEAGAELLVYTATVSAALLRLFHYPSEAPCPSHKDLRAGIKVEYTRVPVWPVLGLKERLGRALGRDLVGDWVDGVLEEGAHLETWGMLSEEEVKRRHAEKQKAAAARKERMAQASAAANVAVDWMRAERTSASGDTLGLVLPSSLSSSLRAQPGSFAAESKPAEGYASLKRKQRGREKDSWIEMLSPKGPGFFDPGNDSSGDTEVDEGTPVHSPRGSRTTPKRRRFNVEDTTPVAVAS